MSKADGDKKYCKKYVLVLLVLFLATALTVTFFVTGDRKEEKKENVGDIICERIKAEIPIRELKISNDGESFFLEAKTGKEEVFAFFEEKLGKMGNKLRIAQNFLPEEIRLSCRVTLKKGQKGKGVRPVITHMSINEYEIPAAFLENIVDFPLILKDFYSIIDS